MDWQCTQIFFVCVRTYCRCFFLQNMTIDSFNCHSFKKKHYFIIGVGRAVELLQLLSWCDAQSARQSACSKAWHLEKGWGFDFRDCDGWNYKVWVFLGCLWQIHQFFWFLKNWTHRHHQTFHGSNGFDVSCGHHVTQKWIRQLDYPPMN